MIWRDNNLMFGTFVVGRIRKWPGKKKGYQALCDLPGVRTHIGVFEQERAKMFVENAVNWWLESAEMVEKNANP